MWVLIALVLSLLSLLDFIQTWSQPEATPMKNEKMKRWNRVYWANSAALETRYHTTTLETHWCSSEFTPENRAHFDPLKGMRQRSLGKNMTIFKGTIASFRELVRVYYVGPHSWWMWLWFLLMMPIEWWGLLIILIDTMKWYSLLVGSISEWVWISQFLQFEVSNWVSIEFEVSYFPLLQSSINLIGLGTLPGN